MAITPGWNRDFGDDSPPLDDSQKYWNVGDIRWSTDPTSPIFGWTCTVAGRPGTWVARYAGLGTSNAIPRVANIAALAAIVTTSYVSTEAHLAEVLSVGDFFKHSPTGGLGTWSAATAYAVGDIVYHGGHSYISIQAGTNQTPAYLTAYWRRSLERVASAAGTSLWTRLGLENKVYQAQTQWAIDPSNTSGVADDENLGYGTTAAAAKLVPLRSLGEWRRRVRGARYALDVAVVISAMSDSTVEDDANFAGISTGRTVLGPIVLHGTPIVVFSGTITSYTAPTGNNRHLVTDTAIPTSWTASGGVTTTSGSRFIRKVGANVHAPVLTDRGSKTAMLGPATTALETATLTTSVVSAAFAVSDSYEVIRFPKWPGLVASSEQIGVKSICIDFSSPSAATLSMAGSFATFVLCGFLTNVSFRGENFIYNCVFAGPLVLGPGFTSFYNAFLNTTIQFSRAAGENWNGQINFFVGTEFRLWHNGHLGSGGTMHCFDNVGAAGFLSLRHNSSISRVGIVGDGNTSSLINVETYAQAHLDIAVMGGVTAVTTDATPIRVDGSAYQIAAIPIVNKTTGSAVYA